MLSEEPRKWTFDTGQPRIDTDGVEWYACDPYPTWYRWVENEDGNRQLIVRESDTYNYYKDTYPAPWKDQQ